MRLSGHFPVTLDEKGRLAVPIDLRGRPSGPQGDRLFITQFRVERRPCLDAYFTPAWEELLDKLAGKNRFDPEAMRFQRAYVSAARECPVDGQGRVVIPPVLRQYAGLKREAILTGETHKFSIWDREQWQALAADDLKIFDDPARMKALDL